MAPQKLRNLVYYPGSTVSELQALATQPFTNVVLGQFHFTSKEPGLGDLVWNQTPIANISTDVWDAVKQLPQVVSIQLGSGGNGTWSYIAQNMDAAVKTLVAFVGDRETYGVSGIDLDPEPPGAVPLDVLYQFTLALGAAQQTTPFFLSHVPVPFDGNYFPQIYGPSYYPGMAPYLAWITPQWYGAVGPSAALSAYESFWQPPGPSGPSAAPHPDMIVLGQEAGATDLTQLTSAIHALNAHYDSNWGGVGVWAYPTPGPTGQWAEGIAEALGITGPTGS